MVPRRKRGGFGVRSQPPPASEAVPGPSEPLKQYIAPEIRNDYEDDVTISEIPDFEIDMPDLLFQQPNIPSVDECLSALLSLFPDIDSAYVSVLHDDHALSKQENLVEFLIDEVLRTNGNYPKVEAQDANEDRAGKRKRELSPSEMNAEELDEKYASPFRDPVSQAYIALSRKYLRNSFPLIPAAYIDTEFARHGKFLFPTYKALAQAESVYDEFPVKPWNKLVRARKHISDLTLALEADALGREENMKLNDEFAAASRIYENLTGSFGPVSFAVALNKGTNDSTAKGRSEAEAEQPVEVVEEEEGDAVDEELFECGCCFGEVSFLQMTQCGDGHLFCLECGKRNAETEIGLQKYKLLCMDSSGCRTPFPRHEIRRFCDEKTLDLLDRLEQKDSLRAAEIEDLHECPFCDFAAIIPPNNQDKEFSCQNPDCMMVSCRLCNKETHLPVSCKQKSKEENSGLRRGVEEAMTEALLRKCGKCGLPYVKESGCNKIPCSRCSTINCYLCQQVIKDYKHFNDTTRGGKAGNCPLFDNTDERHHNEVQQAELAAIAKIRTENPDITEEEMRVQLSQVVIDAEKRKIEDGARQYGVNNPVPVAPAAQVPPLPILGHPVPFVGIYPGPYPGPIFAPPAQPRNLFQRVANMIPNPLPARPFHVPGINPRRLNPNIGPPAYAHPPPIPNVPIPPAQVPHAPEIRILNPLVPAPVDDNPGFIRRNFGGNRLIAKARKAARARVAGDHRPLSPLNNNAGRAVAQPPAPVANEKQADARRPAKIAKRR
ncbi:hypothetical protein ABW19_dt0208411 [Dactylella cylindrospora]|nr:hypothetical protein ABW19_dt0208411 [Dactylella cylindrospora]